MSIVKVVRRAHGEEVDPSFLGPTAELLEVAIEALDLGEEPYVKAVLVEHTDGVVRVDRGHEPAPRISDRLQMPRRNEASRAGEGEILHGARPGLPISRRQGVAAVGRYYASA